MHNDDQCPFILLLLGAVLICSGIIDPRFSKYEKMNEEFDSGISLKRLGGKRGVLSIHSNLALTAFFITLWGKKGTRIMYILLGLLAIFYALNELVYL